MIDKKFYEDVAAMMRNFPKWLARETSENADNNLLREELIKLGWTPPVVETQEDREANVAVYGKLLAKWGFDPARGEFKPLPTSEHLEEASKLSEEAQDWLANPRNVKFKCVDRKDAFQFGKQMRQAREAYAKLSGPAKEKEFITQHMADWRRGPVPLPEGPKPPYFVIAPEPFISRRAMANIGWRRTNTDHWLAPDGNRVKYAFGEDSIRGCEPGTLFVCNPGELRPRQWETIAAAKARGFNVMDMPERSHHHLGGKDE